MGWDVQVVKSIVMKKNTCIKAESILLLILKSTRKCVTFPAEGLTHKLFLCGTFSATIYLLSSHFHLTTGLTSLLVQLNVINKHLDKSRKSPAMNEKNLALQCALPAQWFVIKENDSCQKYVDVFIKSIKIQAWFLTPFILMLLVIYSDCV